MTQVNINLLTNAIKFSPESDDILIKTQFIDDKLKISFISHGIGIAKEDHGIIFEKFNQV